jgi:hypothetical protein
VFLLLAHRQRLWGASFILQISLCYLADLDRVLQRVKSAKGTVISFEVHIYLDLMSWSEVVHENRKRSELQRAREELRLRRRGYAVEVRPRLELTGPFHPRYIYVQTYVRTAHSGYHGITYRRM